MNNLIDVSKITKKMNNRQKIAFNRLDRVNALRYAMSFVGIRESLGLNKPKQPDIYRSPVKIYSSKGECLNNWLRSQRRIYDARSTKVPTNPANDWIGVEIECFLSKSDFDSNTNDCECECTCTCDGSCSVGNCRCECSGDCRDNCDCGSDNDDYTDSVISALNRAKIKNVEAVNDGSVCSDDDDVFGIEIKCLFRMSDYSNLEKLCQWLKDHSATVNKTCGLHVHLDARDNANIILNEYKSKLPFSEGNFVFNLNQSLKYLVGMLPKSRQKNGFCQKGYSFEDRYYMINCTSLHTHKTIEIRAHSGTVVFDKIINWVKILYAIKTAKVCNVHSFDSWVSSIGLTPELSSYAKNRISKFNPVVLSNEDIELIQSSDSIEESEVA